MLRREVLNREIERVENRLKVLSSLIGQPGITGDDFRKEINNIADKIENLKSIVARERFSADEINPLS